MIRPGLGDGCVAEPEPDQEPEPYNFATIRI
jgi:hypothetical protein